MNLGILAPPQEWVRTARWLTSSDTRAIWRADLQRDVASDTLEKTLDPGERAAALEMYASAEEDLASIHAITAEDDEWVPARLLRAAAATERSINTNSRLSGSILAGFPADPEWAMLWENDDRPSRRHFYETIAENLGRETPLDHSVGLEHAADILWWLATTETQPETVPVSRWTRFTRFLRGNASGWFFALAGLGWMLSQGGSAAAAAGILTAIIIVYTYVHAVARRCKPLILVQSRHLSTASNDRLVAVLQALPGIGAGVAMLAVCHASLTEGLVAAACVCAGHVLGVTMIGAPARE